MFLPSDKSFTNSEKLLTPKIISQKIKILPPFFKMGQSQPLFSLFSSFLVTISIIQIEKSADGVLGIRTRSHKMVGADETTILAHIGNRFPSQKRFSNDRNTLGRSAHEKFYDTFSFFWYS